MSVKINDLRKNLDILEQLFTNTNEKKKVILFSKLALLELCGWIETTMDSIINENAKKRNLDPEDEKFIRGKVTRTYSFEYIKFRDLVILLIGVKKTKLLETSMNNNFVLMEAKLNELFTKRCKLAHTHSDRTTKIIDSPQIMKSDFNDLLKYLKEYERKLKRIKLYWFTKKWNNRLIN
jgi:hypothetical protein